MRESGSRSVGPGSANFMRVDANLEENTDDWPRAEAHICRVERALGALATASARAAAPAGWIIAGNLPTDHEFGADTTGARETGRAAFIKAKVASSSGFGTLWADAFRLEIVDKSVAVTASASTPQRDPVNLGFEE